MANQGLVVVVVDGQVMHTPWHEERAMQVADLIDEAIEREEEVQALALEHLVAVHEDERVEQMFEFGRRKGSTNPEAALRLGQGDEILAVPYRHGRSARQQAQHDCGAYLRQVCGDFELIN